MLYDTQVVLRITYKINDDRLIYEIGHNRVLGE